MLSCPNQREHCPACIIISRDLLQCSVVRSDTTERNFSPWAMNTADPDKKPNSVKGSKHNDSSARRVDSLSAATSRDMQDSHKSWEQASESGSDKSGGTTCKPPAADASNEVPATGKEIKAKMSHPQPVETSPTSAGYHPFNTLQGVHLPGYVKEHNATLTFPEKVRF